MFIPDPFKLDVIKFFDSNAGKALLTAMDARKPESPDKSLPHSTKLSGYDQRAGYELAMSELRKIPHESQSSTETPKISPLLDTRD